MRFLRNIVFCSTILAAQIQAGGAPATADIQQIASTYPGADVLRARITAINANGKHRETQLLQEKEALISKKTATPGEKMVAANVIEDVTNLSRAANQETMDKRMAAQEEFMSAVKVSIRQIVSEQSNPPSVVFASENPWLIYYSPSSDITRQICEKTASLPGVPQPPPENIIKDKPNSPHQQAPKQVSGLLRAPK